MLALPELRARREIRASARQVLALLVLLALPELQELLGRGLQVQLGSAVPVRQVLLEIRALGLQARQALLVTPV